MPTRNVNIILLAACLSVLCYFAHRRTRAAILVGEALELIDSYYVDPVDRDQLLLAAMDGMTAKLDEHSEYIPREDYESFQDNITQEFAGIGIFVEQPAPGKPVRVVTPLVGSPALKAGLLPGDLIVQVNGEDVSSMELHEVSKRLKGQPGTTVNLTVQRDQKRVSMAVQRGMIALESVIGDYRDQNNRWVYRLREQPSIAYVRLTSFGEKTVQELEAVLKELDNDFSALVLDLRGNGGGLLHAAVNVSNMFLASGPIVSTQTRGGEVEDRFTADPGTLVDADKPVAVLIDGNSASASEIVAAALQDNDRAAVVGTRSYGKGTVQNILPLQYGRSALRLTVARYYRPNGENIHREVGAGEEDQWGVRPNPGMVVQMDEAALERLARRWRESSYPSLATPSSAETETEVSSENQSKPNVQSESQIKTPDKRGEQSASALSSPASDADGSTEASPVESSLDVDPQLRRAVEYLRKRLQTGKQRATAA